ncbi:endonuclease/exonuclease/phosphatase family protein [Oceanobacillus rekensis]|uniref:endonuclease/exonuclease/phosphatase family protein n=1 Tax=Oceanobacillus rekensis TaxID=937927 RepID=UPI000B453AAA|nr:endonuclease/exonuclease/phosphatase family protein [Oceanobacillus rekensis]
MKKTVVGLALSILVVFSLTSNVFADDYGQEVDVKVMSYNIYHGVGQDGKLDLPRIAKVIQDADADIIGLQEVDRFYGDRSDFQDQTRELAKLLGYHYVYGANLNLEPAEGQEENRQYGTGILSKYPIIDSENIYLSSFGNEQRGLLRTKINVRGVQMNFFNTHLGLNAPERNKQVEEIIEVKSSFEDPSVLVGDLNAEPNSEEFQLLLNKGNFVDTFSEVENSNTFPVVDPMKRIDYILTSPDIKFTNPEVIYTEASDHLPLVTELTIRR